MSQLFFALAGISGALAVALGAFGAHALRRRLSHETIETFRIGVQYQMYHALALLGVALALERSRAPVLLTSAGWLFILGTLLFSGSLYLLTLLRLRWLGSVTPLGGIAFIVGWLCLFLAAFS
ncbi:MAG: DUF423 domain-containing protein [Chloroflexi bacterium]|nr:DUF423 domain-containing protein [Chloroflexota bacterium]